jgi:hypothetical protein
VLIVGLYFVPARFTITDDSLKVIGNLRLADDAVKKLSSLQGVSVIGEKEFSSVISAVLSKEELPKRAFAN